MINVKQNKNVTILQYTKEKQNDGIHRCQNI